MAGLKIGLPSGGGIGSFHLSQFLLEQRDQAANLDSSLFRGSNRHKGFVEAVDCFLNLLLAFD